MLLLDITLFKKKFLFILDLDEKKSQRLEDFFLNSQENLLGSKKIRFKSKNSPDSSFNMNHGSAEEMKNKNNSIPKSIISKMLRLQYLPFNINSSINAVFGKKKFFTKFLGNQNFK